MSSVVLEENWDEIVERVIKPLWKRKFKSMYEAAKLDEDDFYSLASLELTKAFANYKENESNVFTYATNVLKKKALTELRNCTRRDKRRTLYGATSLNKCISEDNDDEIISEIPCEKRESYNELTEKRVGTFVNALSNQQLRVLILNLLDFDYDDMPDMLNISKKTMREILKGLRCEELRRILYRRKF